PALPDVQDPGRPPRHGPEDGPRVVGALLLPRGEARRRVAARRPPHEAARAREGALRGERRAQGRPARQPGQAPAAGPQQLPRDQPLTSAEPPSPLGAGVARPVPPRRRSASRHASATTVSVGFAYPRPVGNTELPATYRLDTPCTRQSASTT